MKFTAWIKKKIVWIIAWVLQISFLSVIWMMSERTMSIPADLMYAHLLSLVILGAVLIYDFLTSQKYLKELEELYELSGFTGRPGKAPTAELEKAGQLLVNARETIITNRDKCFEQQRETVDFFGAWIHEVKTPSSVIRLLSEKIGKEEGSQIRSQLQRIDENLDRALFYLRASSFNKDYAASPIDLNRLVKERIKLFSQLFIKKRIRLQISDSHYEVYSDTKWVAFIIDQILQNALRYTPEQGFVSIDVSKDPNGTRLIIEDTGIGISAQDLPRIFERGFCGKNGRDFGGGTGLGLYLAQLLAKRLDLSLMVTSGGDNKGTVAAVHFPVWGNHLSEVE